MSIESRSEKYGSILGQWQVEEVLGTGSGGKSMVFSLRHLDINSDLYSAMKVITLIEEQGSIKSLPPFRQQEYAAAEDEVRRQAAREVRLMEQLRGKTNIVDYLDHKFLRWQDGSGFGLDLLIRMEKLTDLRSQLRLGIRFSPEEIRRIGTDLCRALILCHSKNILHRDIKPENIFFNGDKDYKLGDFGIARIMNDTPSRRASTGIGTAAYASPEQNSGNYDHRVDIYSLGLVLYELANENRLPFAASGYITERDIQTRLSGIPLAPPCGIDREDPQLSAIILKACAFHPDDRFQSAQEMLLALETPAYRPEPVINPDILFSKQDPHVTQPAAKIPVTHTPYSTQPVAGAPASGTPYSTLPVTETPAAGIPYSTLPVTETPAAGIPYSTLPVTEIPRVHRSVPADPIVTGEPVNRSSSRRTVSLVPLLLPLLSLAVVAALFLFSHRHSWVDATCLEAQYCSGCGEIQGTPLGHSWLDATCTDPKICEVCGFRSGQPLDHSWSAGSCVAESICTTCGQSQGIIGTHSWIDPTCTDPETCTTCGENRGSALGHDWTAATNTSPETCRRCGLTQGRSLGLPLTRCRMLETTNNGSRKEDIVTGTWTDAFGSTHYEALRFWVAQFSTYTDTEYIVYDLDGSYSQLELRIAPLAGSTANSSTQIQIYADNALIYSSQWVSTGSGAVTATLDVSDVRQLKVLCSTDSPTHCYCIVSATLFV